MPAPNLASLVADFRQRFPAVGVDAATLGQHLARVAPEVLAAPERLDERHVDDLALAASALAGDPEGTRLVVASVEGAIRARLGSLRVAADRIDDLTQLTMGRLFVGGHGGGRPGLATYAGKVPLASFAALAAARLALNEARDADVGVRGARDLALVQALTAPSPEQLVARAEVHSLLRTAIAQALDELSPRERVLLRLRLVEDVGVAQIAVSFATHRTTITRWLADAMASLRRSVRATLAGQRGVAKDELLGELDVLAESQLELSLSRLLG